MISTPKLGDLLNINNNWKHVSLAGMGYKIITKALALWIQPYMHNLISHQQMAFFKGKNIVDGIIL